MNDPTPTPKRGVGQPSKLTPERSKLLLDLIRRGNYLKVACAAVGLHPYTVDLWVQRGERDGKGQYFEFFEAYQKARAEAEIRHVENVRKAGDDANWQASAWWLERTNPERWGRKDKVEHSGKDGKPIEVEITARDLARATILERRHVRDESEGEPDDEPNGGANAESSRHRNG